jgi:hypothetical protein
MFALDIFSHTGWQVVGPIARAIPQLGYCKATAFFGKHSPSYK